MALRIHTHGSDRPWQQRPSDHLLGDRRHWHGPIVGLEEPGFLRRLFNWRAK